ncbi:hypothetical protein OUZ56_021490 [Daphnia magna]|uniref:Uncharacterized protein n=1 Tax=Daphnia magna TaxID=35525 RepID=A0ABQ9ZHI6_9CRUS|nr:hypothetical protein OUZ56_021490 [Daphnia magna]
MTHTVVRSPGIWALPGVGPDVRLVAGSIIQGQPSTVGFVASICSISTAAMDLAGILAPLFATIFVAGVGVSSSIAIRTGRSPNRIFGFPLPYSISSFLKRLNTSLPKSRLIARISSTSTFAWTIVVPMVIVSSTLPKGGVRCPFTITICGPPKVLSSRAISAVSLGDMIDTAAPVSITASLSRVDL